MDVSFRAAVMGHHSQPSNGKVVYEIVVVALNFGSAEASRRWTVEARFSDFHALHTRLKKATSSCVLQFGNEVLAVCLLPVVLRVLVCAAVCVHTYFIVTALLTFEIHTHTHTHTATPTHRHTATPQQVPSESTPKKGVWGQGRELPRESARKVGPIHPSTSAVFRQS